jgi:hypothetical protein
MSAPFQMVVLFVVLASSTVVAIGALSGIPSPSLRRGGIQIGVENMKCTAPVAAPVEFEAFAFLELQGQPELVTQKDLTKLQDSLVVSYNSVIMCNQQGAFKVVDEVEVLPKELADNFLSPHPAGVDDFTYVVVSVNVSGFFAVLQSIKALISHSFTVFLYCRRFEDAVMPVQTEFVSLVPVTLLYHPRFAVTHMLIMV